jgi:hypothetical protein
MLDIRLNHSSFLREDLATLSSTARIYFVVLLVVEGVPSIQMEQLAFLGGIYIERVWASLGHFDVIACLTS